MSLTDGFRKFEMKKLGELKNLDFSADDPPKFGMADKVQFTGNVKLDLSRPKTKF